MKLLLVALFSTSLVIVLTSPLPEDLLQRAEIELERNAREEDAAGARTFKITGIESPQLPQPPKPIEEAAQALRNGMT